MTKILPAHKLLRPRTINPQSGRIVVMDAEQLRRFILDFTPGEMQQVKELWREHAARKNLIDFEANDARAPKIRL
jgi:hypothetical protein